MDWWHLRACCLLLSRSGSAGPEKMMTAKPTRRTTSSVPLLPKTTRRLARRADVRDKSSPEPHIEWRPCSPYSQSARITSWRSHPLEWQAKWSRCPRNASIQIPIPQVNRQAFPFFFTSCTLVPCYTTSEQTILFLSHTLFMLYPPSELITSCLGDHGRQEEEQCR